MGRRRLRRTSDMEGASDDIPNVTHEHAAKDDSTIAGTDDKHEPDTPRLSVEQPYTPPNPSASLLFLFVPTRLKYLLLLPACLVSIIAGGVAPFMTIVLGQGFQAFSEFAVSPRTSEEKSELLRRVGIVGIQLLALGVGAIALSALLGSLWILVGERNMLGVRNHVYDIISKKDMAWFDLNMRADLHDPQADGLTPAVEGGTAASGAAGLMARFSKYVLSD
jgi:ATP-binding cassette, subfamily B (MDR/TAP), member 1